MKPGQRGPECVRVMSPVRNGNTTASLVQVCLWRLSTRVQKITSQPRVMTAPP